jgi:hypothetical protein
VDDTFVVWSQAKDELQEFLRHLNSIHPNTTFTVEVEQNKVLPFLDDLVSRPDGSLGHSVYRKSTHTDLYLHAKSQHHPEQKWAGLTALVRRARTVSDPESLRGEIQHLKCVFTGMDTARKISDGPYTQNRSHKRRGKNLPVQPCYRINRPSLTKSAGS